MQSAKTPRMGACRFRASNRWMAGAHNRTTVTGFYGAMQEIPHKQSFMMDADEPEILAGNDAAANPVEHLLHALASCLTTSMVAHAAVRGIAIESVESELEGDIDLNGFLGLSPENREGFYGHQGHIQGKSQTGGYAGHRVIDRVFPGFQHPCKGRAGEYLRSGPVTLPVTVTSIINPVR